MISLWMIYALVAVLFVIFLVIVAIGFTRSGRKRATEFHGVAGEADTGQKKHEREAQRP